MAWVAWLEARTVAHTGQWGFTMAATVVSQCYAFIRPDLPDVEVSFPGTVTGPGVSSSFGVLKFGNLEVELNDSSLELLSEHFTAVSATQENEITLSTGLPAVIGRIDSSASRGHCFGVKVGTRCLLGSVPDTVSVETLAAWLSDLHITSSKAGLTVSPGKATWSEERTPNVVVAVTSLSGHSILLDIRPAFRGFSKSRAGIPVHGGYLSRQDQPDQSGYLVLNAAEYVVYVLSSSDEGLDEAAEIASGVTVRSFAS